MSLRPSPASWFEVLVLRDDLTAAIDALARSSKVELQSHGESRTPLLMPECRERLVEFDELRQRYGRTKFGQSCLAARRLIEQGGGYINGRRLEAFDYLITPKDFDNMEILLRAGKKRFHKIKIKN